MIEIVPLSISMPEWKTFVSFCENHLGFSPTRGLDNIRMQLNDPISFLASLDLKNDPLNALREGGQHLDHYFLSFFMFVEHEHFLALVNNSSLRIMAHEAKRDYVLIVTGSIADWKASVIQGCSRRADKEYRILMNKVYDFFVIGRFKEVFSNFKRTQLNDKTFILEA